MKEGTIGLKILWIIVFVYDETIPLLGEKNSERIMTSAVLVSNELKFSRIFFQSKNIYILED